MRTSRISRHRGARGRLPAALLAALLLGLGGLAGCGGGSSGGLSTDGDGPVALQVALFPPYRPDVTVGNWRLTCEPAGGSLPNAAAACAAILADPSVLEPPACRGERIADRLALRVIGTFRGQNVEFHRGGSAIGDCTEDRDAIGRLLAALGNPVP